MELNLGDARECLVSFWFPFGFLFVSLEEKGSPVCWARLPAARGAFCELCRVPSGIERISWMRAYAKSERALRQKGVFQSGMPGKRVETQNSVSCQVRLLRHHLTYRVLPACYLRVAKSPSPPQTKPQFQGRPSPSSAIRFATCFASGRPLCEVTCSFASTHSSASPSHRSASQTPARQGAG